MERVEAMRIFTRVVELQSFTKAADSLSLPKANVSAAVAQLESTLGTRLLNRTTRRVAVSPDGQSFYDRCLTLVAEIDEAEAMFRSGAELVGRLRVDMPVGVAAQRVVPRLPEFLSRHPKLHLELSTTDRMVDVVGEGFDCVIRVGGTVSPELHRRELSRMEVINCASPAYLERFGRPETLEDLAHHHLIHYVPTLGGRSSGFEVWDGRACRYVEMGGILTVNNSDVYRATCLAGLGIIQAPLLGMRELLAKGELRRIMPGLDAEPMPLCLLFPSRRYQGQRVRVFGDWLAEVLRL